MIYRTPSLIRPGALALCCLSLAAHAQREPKEVTGAKDHPQISRFAGSVLQDVGSSNYAEIAIPGGPRKTINNQNVYDKTEKASGTLSGFFYINPKNRSALEIFRNYEQALSSNGFTVMHSCGGGKSCEDNFEAYRNELFKSFSWKSNSGSASSAIENNIRFLTAKKTSGSNTTHAVLFVAEPDSVWQATASVLVVVDSAALTTGQVIVNDAAMKNDLASTGKVALYGIYFDTGKAEVKPESKAQLDEMAKLLNGSPQMNVYIVGHTDNEGGLDSNMALSQRRAEAVAAALASQYRIAPKRLIAKGVANLSPVATNGTADGRAKNRRVELVIQ